MTNGEKLKEVFPNIQIFNVTENELREKFIYIRLGDVCQAIELEWWNAEYKEPTTKNDLAVDCISREKALDVIRNLYPSMPRVDFNGSLRKWVDEYKPYIECEDAIEELPSVTPQEPQTFKWCTDCREYDQEKHCCHRWSKVIRDTVEEMKKEYIEREVLDEIRAEITTCLKALDEIEKSGLNIYLPNEMSGRRLTYKQCLEFVDKAESEDT